MNNLNPSRKLAARSRSKWFLALFLLAGLPAISVTRAAGLAATNAPAAIPWNQIGAKAGADYKGDGLAVTSTESGARLHCVFQRLDGEATPEGLWLTSTLTNTVSDRFRVTAIGMGRTTANATFNSSSPESSIPLAGAGDVSVSGQAVRFSRPGLTEEYSVSMDGVRQDFIVEQAPARSPGGELVVQLVVAGAEVEAAADGARLVLAHSGRKIAYSRLRVTDATGKELPARIEVREKAESGKRKAEMVLAVVVNDAGAVYPVRIDPTFSDANWVSLGGFLGASGPVLAAVIDGSGKLYIGGVFTFVGNTFATNVAEWNGSSWSAVGSGLGGYGAQVNALAVSGSTLYAGGDLPTAGNDTNANGIAQWNGTSWSALGSGMGAVDRFGDPVSGSVSALAVSGGTLYAGGYFTTAGGNAANNIAQWNGSSWSALGSGLGGVYGATVNALAVSGGTLYAGGDFITAGDTNAYGIAQWNGSSWSPLGSGMDSPVLALAVSGSTLYAGGIFTNAGGSAANYIAKWNGTSWSALGSGLGVGYGLAYVNALAVSGSTLYAGGFFYTAGSYPANFIAKWNGSSWSALGSGLGGNGVNALAVSGGTLYAGGDFSGSGSITANNIAKWNGTSWSALGSGFDGPVSALAVSGSTLYAGGSFTRAGSSAATGIAQWNGTSWSPLGSGLSYVDPYGDVGSASMSALAVSGSTLYAGGVFTRAGGSAATNIAQWNGSSWSALGSGMDYSVNALAVSGGTLYAGGNFTMAGGNAANNIAQWNGSSWSALGSGMNSTVSALAVSGSMMYAGGEFTTAGGNSATNIAQWNGSSWSALGSGISGAGGDINSPYVKALAVSGSTLYAGGEFTTAGGNSANNIAQWNGTSWSALGSGMGGTGYPYYPNVSALVVSGGTLYAGGDFSTAGGTAAIGLAQWNGSSWSALGSGISGVGVDGYDPYVSALAVSGSTLYVGGDFTMAGTNVSPYAAMAYLPVPPTLSIIADGANAVLTWPAAGTGYTTGYTLESATNLLPPVAWQTNSTAPIVIFGQNVITNPISSSPQFFRLFNP
jgi:hypothetical protein